MSNDIDYNLRFRSHQRKTLAQVKDYLTEKKLLWDGRGSKTAEALLKQAGLKHPAEVVTWGFEFWSIRKGDDGAYSVDVSSWANENSLGNIWISGEEGELKFLIDKFPGLAIEGEFDGEYGGGLVDGWELIYQEQEDNEDDHEWGQTGDATYNKATTELLLVLYNSDYGLSAEDVREALKNGADPNAWMDGAPLLNYVLQDSAFAKSKERLEALRILFAQGMCIERQEDIGQMLLVMPGLPEPVRRFAEQKNLTSATDGKTRLQIFRYLLRKKLLNTIPVDILKIICPEAMHDREIVKLVVAQFGETISHASKDLRADKDLVLRAVKGSSGNGNYLVYASRELRDDPDVALAAVKSDGSALEHVSARLRNDRKIVSTAVKSSGWALRYASKQLRADRKIVLMAVKQIGVVLEFASQDLKKDIGVVQAAISSQDCGGSEAFEFAAKKLQRDPDLKKMLKDIEG